MLSLLIAIALAECALLLWLPWHVAALLLILYTLRWVDRAEHSGHASWPAWRSAWWWWWRAATPVAEVVAPPAQQQQQAQKGAIYLVTPCGTASTLLWGIGLSCGAGSSDATLWTLPAYYFWVPGVRDFLLWSGAVSHFEGNIAALLEAGYNVCYAMPPMPAAAVSDDEVYTQLPSDWLLQIAINEHLKLQIITVQGEDEQYHMHAHIYWRRLRWLCARRIHLYYGTRVDAQSYSNVAALKAGLTATIARNSITALGDKIIKSQ